ncbi:hypothetical protein [Hyphobacterium sp.]|uniref:hypothetical protein n=1 Tax=Hyphobacterium sp. TaxID=2004662 RepID=UPI003BABA0DD
MVDRSVLSRIRLDFRKRSGTSAIFFFFAFLTGCGVAPQPDQETYFVCADSADKVQGVALIVSEAAARFGYSYEDRGDEARSNLLNIDANPALIPDEAPIHAIVRDHSQRVVLSMTNFTLFPDEVKISFLSYEAHDNQFQFSQEILVSLAEFSTVRANSESREGPDQCGS